MSRVLIWDLPLRVVHWGLAGSLTAALVLGLAVDDDHPWFAYHMLFGLFAGGFVLVRLVLALVGSRHARFSSLVLNPRELMKYASGAITGHARRFSSHNPGTSWMTLLLWVSVGVLIVTGLVPEGVLEEIHEGAAYAVLVLIGAHLAGLLLHTIRHREAIAWAMIDGRKEAPDSAALPSAQTLPGVLVTLLAVTGILGILRSFDRQAGRVNLPGTQFSLDLPVERGHGEHESDHESHDD